MSRFLSLLCSASVSVSCVLNFPHSTAQPATADKLLLVSFWKDIAPDMHIYDSSFSNTLAFHFTDQAMNKYLRDLIRTEGYAQLDPVAFSPMSVTSMADTVEKIHVMGIPLPFVYVYDEFWLIFVAMHHIIEPILGPGYFRLPDFWAWRVDAAEEQKGWSFHRDKRIRTIGMDGLPKALTVWIPLTDATTLNGCIYMLPADRDPVYNQSSIESQEILAENLPILQVLQDFRALPAKAGSVLLWNQQVYHYGSRASKRSPRPRISLAVEFQSQDIKPLNSPLYYPLNLPTFKDRLQLIAKQIIQYKHMYPFDNVTYQFAEKILNWRIDPHVEDAATEGVF